MNDDTNGAEFSALTDEEQGTVVGGDGTFASMVGWFVSYAITCTQQAVIYDYKLMTKQPLIYVEGKGFI